MKPLHFIANWKMHGRQSDVAPYLNSLALDSLAGGRTLTICPPATLLSTFCAETAALPVQVGAQDCHPLPDGAHTGDIAAPMLRDLGASHVIIGHSERRAHHAEDDTLVQAKVQAAWEAGLSAILCIGESATDRQEGRTLAFVTHQLAECLPKSINARHLIIAYEPVWAIGTGKVPKPGEIDSVHAAIKDSLTSRTGSDATSIPVVYGGSVNPANANAIMSCASVDGCLVGGASLEGETFSEILRACA